jgi:endonuclease/exonuclease/phosphatase family metal-dependent hydrolase
MENRAADVAAILTGDFNAGIEAAPQQVLATRLKGADWIIPAPQVEAGTYHAFTGSPGGLFIDSIFITPQLSFLAGRVLQLNSSGSYPSDHFPVLVECELVSPGD